MLEFEILQELEPNDKILEIIKNYDFTIKKGQIKHLKVTNLQFIKPNIIFVSSKIIEMNSAQQNKIALSLFNSINFKIKNYKSIGNIKQTF